MKLSGKRFAAMMCLFVFMFCLICGCTEPEIIGSGTKNKTYTESVETLVEPIFSDRGGFYQDKMLLTISVPKAFDGQDVILRVTYDGSEPNLHSEEYSGEIKLPDVGFVKTGMPVLIKIDAFDFRERHFIFLLQNNIL